MQKFYNYKHEDGEETCSGGGSDGVAVVVVVVVSLLSLRDGLLETEAHQGHSVSRRFCCTGMRNATTSPLNGLETFLVFRDVTKSSIFFSLRQGYPGLSQQ